MAWRTSLACMRAFLRLRQRRARHDALESERAAPLQNRRQSADPRHCMHRRPGGARRRCWFELPLFPGDSSTDQPSSHDGMVDRFVRFVVDFNDLARIDTSARAASCRLSAAQGRCRAERSGKGGLARAKTQSGAGSRHRSAGTSCIRRQGSPAEGQCQVSPGKSAALCRRASTIDAVAWQDPTPRAGTLCGHVPRTDRIEVRSADAPSASWTRRQATSMASSPSSRTRDR